MLFEGINLLKCDLHEILSITVFLTMAKKKLVNQLKKNFSLFFLLWVS